MPTMREYVAAFLRANPAEGYCTICVSSKVGATLAEGRQAVAGLATTGEFKIAPGRCGSCRRKTEVVTYPARA